MPFPEAEKREIVSVVKEMMDEFEELQGIDNREFLFKRILDYLISKPDFMSYYVRFKHAVLETIRRNQFLSYRHRTGQFDMDHEDIHHWELINPSPILNYNYYYNHFI